MDEACANRHRRRSLEALLFDLLGSSACGNTVAPCDWMALDGGLGPSAPYVQISEDGSSLWIGTANEWHLSMSRTEARKLALWVVFRWWIVGEWFGLRRWLWFRLLHRRVRSATCTLPPPPEAEPREEE